MALPKLNASRKVRTPSGPRPVANPVTRTRNRLVLSLAAGLVASIAILFLYTLPQYNAVKAANQSYSAAQANVTATAQLLGKAKANPNISSLYYAGYQRYAALLPVHDPNGGNDALYALISRPIAAAGVNANTINIGGLPAPATLAVPTAPGGTAPLQYYQVAVGFTATLSQLQQALRNITNATPLMTINSITSLNQTGITYNFQGTLNIWFYPTPGL